MLDLKKKLEEKEIVLLKAIKGFKELLEGLETFRKRKRFIIMLRGRKRDGMRATETFDRDVVEIKMMGDIVYRELRSLTEATKELSQILDFLDKGYLDDAALFLSGALSAERKKTELLKKHADTLEIFQEALKDICRDDEMEAQIHLCSKSLREYIKMCLENEMLLAFATERANHLRNKKSDG